MARRGRRRRMRLSAPMTQSQRDGSFRFRFSERIAEVVNTGRSNVIAKSFNPGKSGMTRLDNIAKGFDRYRINSVLVKYLPSVGMTADGAITFGIDWDFKSGTSSEWVLGLFPKVRTPGWKSAQLLVPRTIMPSTWLPTSLEDNSKVGASFTVGIHTPDPTKNFGEIWLDYDVTFNGSKAMSLN